jgi:hypothetical protein
MSNNIKSLNSGLALKYENGHVFNMRLDGILACVKFEAQHSDPAYVD